MCGDIADRLIGRADWVCKRCFEKWQSEIVFEETSCTNY